MGGSVANGKNAAVSFSLDAKYTAEDGVIVLSGVQALVRLPLDQHRADKRRGLNTATLISGYRGSPLGGIDLTLNQNAGLLREHQVVFIPGINEDLGATAVFGSQIANLMPGAKYDGVLGMWYGKSPGVDRSGDAFKHANFAGVGRNGGVLALAGDDPISKSSTLPSHSEVAFFDAHMPVLFPGNVQEILDLGRCGFELSRYSGLWVGFKVVTNIADEFSSALVAPDRVVTRDPGFQVNGSPWKHNQNPTLVAPFSLQMEREIFESRLEAAKAFAAANDLNRITISTPDDWLGIVAAGKTYYDLRQALREMGLDDSALQRSGVRLLKLGMIYPLEPNIIRKFAAGLEEILVVEEKRAFIELFLRDALYNLPERPRVVGKQDEAGRVLVPAYGELDSDELMPLLIQRIGQRVPLDHAQARVEKLRQPAAPVAIPLLPRVSHFCSGCPHNRSTVVPEGSLAGGGIGCHGMALRMDRGTVGITHMGAEGANWVGIAPFTEMRHMFQNLGDGTLFHSGSLAIRQAVAAGANITYKILYNSAVAMTGGQVVDGAMPVPELTRMLASEGVKQIYVLSDQPEKYAPDARWAEGVQIWHRDRLDEAQRILREIPGVTALIYDQECAAELRRKRRRGFVADPTLRVFINEAVCEGCGDCGVKSNCLSVQPVETEFGRKTQIHQSSCNKDYSCMDGDCPAFITINVKREPQKRARPIYEVHQALPDPEIRVGEAVSVCMTGIGGTGVVTTNQILGTAAVLSGKHIASLDQTGLSQKGGPVVSHLKISAAPLDESNKIGLGEADCYLVFDVLTGLDAKNLSRASAGKTIAVVSSSKVPTGMMVSSTEVQFPNVDRLLEAIERTTRREHNVYVDAIALAEALFDNHMAANMIVVGAAFQTGALPLTAEAIEQAINLNGVSVRMNLNAFRVGRLLVADPAWIKSVDLRRKGAVEVRPQLTPEARQLIAQVGAEGKLLRLLEIRVPELLAYQNVDYARQYVEFVKRVKDAEAQAIPGETQLSAAVARYLFKLMAYKDEYEVARLHLRQEVHQALTDQFGDDVEIHYRLHPPFLRALGMKNKLKLGRWFESVYRLLVAMRRLRGTPLDPFGYAHVRRVERELVRQYRALIEAALGQLSAENYSRAVRLAQLPDVIRGYEDVKLRNVERFWQEAQKLGFGDLRPDPRPDQPLTARADA